MSWGIAVLFGGLVVFYYSSQKKPQVNKTRAASFSESTQSTTKSARKREETKTKSKAQTGLRNGVTIPQSKPEVETTASRASGVEAGKKRKGAKKQSTAPLAAPLAELKGPAAEEDEDDEADAQDKAWAQNLAALKKGTSLVPPSRTDSRGRTVKQSTANLSSASSNAADADDDLTPAYSPARVAGGVSDMLEPSSSGPSVLRLTESLKPTKARQQRQQAAAETAETKKQRQNKQKVEERRLQREAEEKERQVLLENQRRTAREARGEPAKNGVPAKAPAVSEWALKAAARVTQAPVETVSGGKFDNSTLLDTFEEDQVSMAKRLSEDESGWNTVPKGKKQQKKKAPASDSAEFSGSENVPAPAPIRPSAQVQSSAAAPATKSLDQLKNKFPSSFISEYDTGSHPEDSQWSA